VLLGGVVAPDLMMQEVHRRLRKAGEPPAKHTRLLAKHIVGRLMRQARGLVEAAGRWWA
jgi:hypothetical protein